MRWRRPANFNWHWAKKNGRQKCRCAYAWGFTPGRLTRITAALTSIALRAVARIGSGGSGKTRLAIQVGADELEKFPDGVRFVDLAPLNDASLVVDAIASSVGIKVEQGISVVDALVRTLEGTKTLVIIDNCEHVVKACADTVTGLLRAGESVRVLA